jgi:hypothetical protein
MAVSAGSQLYRFFAPPPFQNYNKRLVKTPKLYFCDTGLAVWLLGIRESGQLTFHAQRGALFENLVVTEFLKAKFNRRLSPDIYFWRDSSVIRGTPYRIPTIKCTG